MEATIRKAISEKRCIEINYDGGVRSVEPHCYGLTKAGNPAFRGFQSSGASSSGNPQAWKMFELSKILSFNLLDEKFTTRDGYKKGDKGMSEIYCEI